MKAGDIQLHLAATNRWLRSGDAASLLRLHDVGREEDEIQRALASGKPQSPQGRIT